MKITKVQLFFFCVVFFINTASDAAAIVKDVGVDAMEKLAKGCEKFILTKDGVSEKIYDFYFSGSGDLLNFFDKLDAYLEKERKDDATYAKMIDYFYVCMNDAKNTSLEQLKIFVDCPAFNALKKTQETLYKKLLKVAGEHLSDGQILKSIRETIEIDSTEEKLLPCLSLKNN